MSNNRLSANHLESVNQPEGKVIWSGNIITPNQKIKVSIKDALVILNRKIAILKHEIAVLRFNTAISCFKMN